jgi:hypothetical protein
MGVTLGQPQVRVPQHFHDCADVHALLHEQSAGSMPTVVNAGVTHTGIRQQVFPFLPVAPGVDRAAVDPAGHQVVTAPAGTRRFSCLQLIRAMLAKDLHEDGGQSDSSPALPLGLAEDLPSASALRTGACVTHAVLGTRRWAGPTVPVAGDWARTDPVPSAASDVLSEAARVRIGAAVPPRIALDLPPNSEVTLVEVDVSPPQA